MEEWAALGASLVPFAVAVVRAAAKDWYPVGDAAYFTVRSRDVLTEHTPLVGAWSSGSSVVGAPVNNLGPLQLDLLAPFTKVSPYLGTAVGAAVTNAICVAVVWFVARRMYRPALVVVVMIGTILFMATLGLSWLIDARQQFAMVLPFYALLWLSAAMWSGMGSAVPIAVAVASLTLQTHFTYAYQAAIVLAAGVAGYAIATWRERRGWLRMGLVAVAVGLVCWIQPLVDQVFRTGNIGDVIRAGDRPGAGVGAGIQIVSGAALVPPFWLPGSIGTFLMPHDGITLAGAAIAAALWLALAGGLIWIGVRAAQRVVWGTGAACVAAIGACLAAASLMPISSFGLVPQNYYWAWSLGAFVSIALAAAAMSAPEIRSRLRTTRSLGAPAVFGPIVAVSLAIAVWPRYPVAWVADDEVEAQRVGAPLKDQLRAALDASAVDDVVEVDLSRAFFGNDNPFVMLVELQLAGIEFRFPPGNRNLNRFGSTRCAEAGRYQRLLIISGRNPRLERGSVVIAEVAVFSNADRIEHLALQELFGDLLRDGDVVVDIDGVERVLEESTDRIDDVLATAGKPAGGLARTLDHWRRWGLVSIPGEFRDDFDEWFELEQRSSAAFQTIVVENPSPGDGSTC